MNNSSPSRVIDASPSGVELRIPDGAGIVHLARWYPHPATDAPLVLHLHAGGFVSAPAAGRMTAIERLLVQAGASVVSLQYPLAPAHPFPHALCAAYTSMLHLYREPTYARKKTYVAGAEAGGNIAAGLAMMVRDRNELPLAGQILFSPMLNPLLATDSQRRAKAGTAGCRFVEAWRRYAPRPSDASHPYAAPADAVRLDGLAQALLFTSDDDPLRDETRAYSQRLIAHGTHTQLLSLPSPTNFPAAYMHEAPAQAPWTAVALDSLRRLFAGTAHS